MYVIRTLLTSLPNYTCCLGVISEVANLKITSAEEILSTVSAEWLELCIRGIRSPLGKSTAYLTW